MDCLIGSAGLNGLGPEPVSEAPGTTSINQKVNPRIFPRRSAKNRQTPPMLAAQSGCEL